MQCKVGLQNELWGKIEKLYVWNVHSILKSFVDKPFVLVYR